MTMKDYGYTLLQHSAWGYLKDPQFIRGLQECEIEGKVDYNKVVKAGGMILPDYVTADKAAEELMYPEGYDGIIPNASGGFSKLTIDNLHIYVPPLGHPSKYLADTSTSLGYKVREYVHGKYHRNGQFIED